PCPPQNVEASIQCQTNMATVTWEPSVGAVSYRARLSGRNGETLYCETLDTFCEVPGLECGVIYYVVVIAIGPTLNSSESSTVHLEAAPCPVEVISVDGDCDNSYATATWSPASGATSYEIIAISLSGHRVSCNTTLFECELQDLECGQNYSIIAVSINDQCSVESDTGINFITRPCKPQRVGANFDCDTATATVYWEDEDGVDFYEVTAVSSSGVIVQCSSSISPCELPSLECSETYNISVVACNQVCCSVPSNTVEVQTGNC
ncbi:hypothetical protein NL108_018671, partial [Boleophthalmus pectinirostris]